MIFHFLGPAGPTRFPFAVIFDFGLPVPLTAASELLNHEIASSKLTYDNVHAIFGLLYRAGIRMKVYVSCEYVSNKRPERIEYPSEQKSALFVSIDATFLVMSATSVAPGAQQNRFAAYLDRLAHAAGHLDHVVPLKSYCADLLLPGEQIPSRNLVSLPWLGLASTGAEGICRARAVRSWSSAISGLL